MSHQIPFKRPSISPGKHLFDGKKMRKLQQSECQTPKKDSTTSNKSNNSLEQTISKNKRKKGKKSATQESQAIIKKKICKDKSIILNKNVQTQKLSQTLVPASTSTEKVLRPFWKEHTKEISNKLPSLTKTDSVDMDMRWSSGSSKKQTLNWWYSAKQTNLTMETQVSQENKNLHRIACQSLMSLLPETMVCDQQRTEEKENEQIKQSRWNKKKNKTMNLSVPTKDETIEESASVGVEDSISQNVVTVQAATQKESIKKTQVKKTQKQHLKTRKIKVYPDKNQRSKLRKWFGTCRWVYNQCVSAIQKKEATISVSDLRTKIVNNTNYVKDNHILQNPWVIETPYELRDGAMNDIVKAFEAYKAKKEQNQSGFKLKFRRKDETQSIVVLAKNWNTKRSAFFSDIFRHDKMKTAVKSQGKLPEELSHDCRLIKDKLDNYYLCIPVAITKKDANEQETPPKVVAIDPGVRTPLTCYDHDGVVTEFGAGDKAKLYTLGKYADQLKSRIDLLSKTKCRKKSIKKRRMKKAYLRMTARIKNLVSDFHKKSINWLLANHKIILLPKFNSQAMASNGKLLSSTIRSMMNWSHGMFRERLLFKSQEYPDCHVEIVTEEYTSCTCGNCGQIKTNLGSSKLFSCSSCGFKCDRDVNGARNILLKWISDSTFDKNVSPSSSITNKVSSSASGEFGSFPLQS